MLENANRTCLQHLPRRLTVPRRRNGRLQAPRSNRMGPTVADILTARRLLGTEALLI